MDFGKLKAHKPRGDTRKKNLNTYAFPAPERSCVRLEVWTFGHHPVEATTHGDAAGVREGICDMD